MDIEISRDICNFVQNLIQRNCSTRPVFLTDRRITLLLFLLSALGCRFKQSDYILST